MEYDQLIVDVVHYEDEDIWVATSEDILGMVVESQGIAAFLIDVVDVAVQLLDLNEQISAENWQQRVFDCVWNTNQVASP